jgi:hypothetical protein
MEDKSNLKFTKSKTNKISHSTKLLFSTGMAYTLNDVMEYTSLIDVLSVERTKHLDLSAKKLAEKSNMKPSSAKNSKILTGKSLFILKPSNYVRIVWSKIVNWKYFDSIIISLIILNSILLGVIDYENPDSNKLRNRIVYSTEPFFTSVFTLEAILKIISFGFIFGKGAYLKDAWNWLDFIVVITSLLSILPNMNNMSGIRTFRLFRPLRSFTSLPSMRTLISTILASMAQLAEILIFSFVVFFIFSILGVSLWSGEIHFRWYATPSPVDGDWQVIEEDKKLWGYRKWTTGYWGSLVEQ